MGESSSSRPSAAEISTIESHSKDPWLVNSLSNGWTDEKHILFLNSIEASFVNELFNGEYHSKAFLGWLSRIKEHKGSRRPYKNDQKSGQALKVLRRGCWVNHRFDSDNNHADIENGSLPLSANPLIQHFLSASIMKERHHKSSDRVDDIEFIRPSVQLASERHDGEATSSKYICHQDSVGCSTEVSDQNFVGDELVAGKRSSRILRKRRWGTAVAQEPINDQVVPSRKAHCTSNSDEHRALLHAMNAESTGRTSLAGLLPAKAEASLYENHEVNS